MPADHEHSHFATPQCGTREQSADVTGVLNTALQIPAQRTKWVGKFLETAGRDVGGRDSPVMGTFLIQLAYLADRVTRDRTDTGFESACPPGFPALVAMARNTAAVVTASPSAWCGA